MQRINQFRYYELGRQLQPIKQFTDETPLSEAMFVILHAKWNLDPLYKDDALPVSRKVIGDFLGILN